MKALIKVSTLNLFKSPNKKGKQYIVNKQKFFENIVLMNFVY